MERINLGAGLVLSPRASSLLALSIERTRSQSAVLFLCDTSAPTVQLRPLYVEGLPTDAVQRYTRSRVYSHDPFLASHLTRRSGIDGGKVVVDPGDHDLQRDPSSASYWKFLSEFDIRVTGAVIKPVSSTMILVGRLYRGATKKGENIGTVANDMGDLLDCVVSQMVSIAAQSLCCDQDREEVLANNFGLSQRQFAITKLLREGLLNKQIAHELSLPEHTIENDLRCIYRKLGVQNRVGLAERLSHGHSDVHK